MTPEQREQRERVIAILVRLRARPLRDRTDEELMALLVEGEASREECDPEYARTRRRQGKSK